MTEHELERIAIEHADRQSANSGQVWVQVWEDAYDSKIEELKSMYGNNYHAKSNGQRDQV